MQTPEGVPLIPPTFGFTVSDGTGQDLCASFTCKRRATH